MKNIYDGIVILDSNGEAIVELPQWFEVLNESFRYQLTPIESASPDLHIKKEISQGHFSIGGGKPSQKICWQVTGVRHDAVAKANPLTVEKEKSKKERGLYPTPELYNQPKEKSVIYDEKLIEMKKMTHNFQNRIDPLKP